MAKILLTRARSPKRDVFSTLQWQRALSQLGRAIASKLSLEAVFGEFAAGIKGYIPYDRLLICRVDYQNKITRLFLLSPSTKDTLDTPPGLYQKGESVTEWIVREKKPFIREDTSLQREFDTDERLRRMGLHSHITVPLIYWDRVVGSFHLASKQPKAYGEQELTFLMSAAEWLAIAMENARFFQETHRLLEEQGVLHEVTSHINVLDLDSLLQRLTNEIINIFKADSAFVRLRDPDGSFRIRAVSGIHSSVNQGANLEENESSSWILRNLKPLVIRDMKQQDLSIPKASALVGMGFRSYLGVPIMLKQEGIGTLGVLNKRARDFTDRDIFFLRQLATEAAMAIHHAMLFDELKRLNQELEKGGQQKSQFLARLAHELKTPLSVIVGILDVMNMGATGPLSEKQKSALNKIQDQSRALQSMINDVLNLSRIEAGTIPMEISTFQVEKLIEFLRPLTEDLQRKTGLNVIWDIEPDLPPLITDADKVRAILQNLIVNAFKYTSEGEVRIRIKNLLQAKSLELAVEDTGTGIAAVELPKIFEGFHQIQSTASSQGVGLGLTIVKKYLELVKGDIQVQSQLGKGSTFTVTLPYTLQT